MTPRVLTNKFGQTMDDGYSTILKAHPELAQVSLKSYTYIDAAFVTTCYPNLA
jgi:hypothetical protein